MKRFGLSSYERIKSKKDFTLLFANGKYLFSENNKVKLIYLTENKANEQIVKFAVAISGKAGNAVWRNRVKRLFRESYRLNKQIITETASKKNISLKVVFIPNFKATEFKKLKLSDIMPEVKDLLIKLKQNIS